MSPRRSLTDKRSGKVWVYLTADEHTQLRRIAKRADLSISGYVRMLVKEALFRIERAEAQRRINQGQGAFDLQFGIPVETRPKTEAEAAIGEELECVNAACPWFPHTYRKGEHEPRSRIEEWRRGVEDGADPRTL